MCDKKNTVLFTETECLVLSPDFKLLDESQVLLKVPRQNNMYSFDLKNVISLGSLTCLFEKATIDESNLWHRRLGHINFKTMNKLVGGNLVRDHKVKTIRCDNGTEFKNRIMNEFYEMKGIRREFSVARTLQQNGVAERKNRTLIEAARTMLADSKLLTTFWAEKPALSFMRSFGCPVTILNTLDHLGTRPNWMFDIDTLTMSMNYQPVFTRNQTNRNAGTNANIHEGLGGMKTVLGPQYVLLLFLTSDPQSPKSSEDEVADDAGKKNEVLDPAKEDDKSGQGEATNTNNTSRLNTVSSSFTTMDTGRERAQRNEFESVFGQDIDANGTSIYRMFIPVNVVGSSWDNLGGSLPVNAAGSSCDNLVNAAEASNAFEEHLFERFSPFKNAFTLPPVSNVTPMDDTGIFGNAYDDEDVGAEADLNNLETTMNVSPIPTTRIDKDHPKDQIIGDFNSAIQTRRMTKISDEHAMKVIQALEDPSWIEAMQEELLQFQLQKVWTLVNLPNGKRAIGTKWVFRNKKDERGIVVRNKARLVAQGYTQEEGIDYDEVFALVARIEAIRLFLAYASFMGFIVYQMDVKSAFLYGTIDEEVYVCQPPGFEDPQFPDKVYKVEKALYGLHQAPRAWYETLSNYIIENGFRRGTIDKTLFIKKDK
ncbi:putative ribonuclease H-like domain-containing protein, partial [Tanacetum coccineum]